VRFAANQTERYLRSYGISGRFSDLIYQASLRLRRLPQRGTLWIVTVVLALVVGLFVRSSLHRADAVRSAYGEQRSVLVATADISPGTVIDDSNTDMRDWPIGLLPQGAVTSDSGRTATERIGKGEVIIDRRLSGDNGSGPEALIPPGGRALAVPTGTASPAVGVGDRVDVFAPLDASRSNSATAAPNDPRFAARRVARAARVIAVDPDSITIAVTALEAPFVAQASLDASIALVLVAPG
jgi:Flp pilus assembly protein CpaB